jgi:hypothetical protein
MKKSFVGKNGQQEEQHEHGQGKNRLWARFEICVNILILRGCNMIILRG